MPDMSVNLCGVTFKNPVIAASGTFAFGAEPALYYPPGELGGMAAKAVTLEPRLGNPAPRIAETASGCLNAVGLQNPGIDAYLQTELPRMLKYGTNIIANVAGSDIDEYVEVTRRLRGSGVQMIELNISCPNVKHGGVAFGTDPKVAAEVTRRVKAECDVPLIVKLSPNVSDIGEMALAAEQAGADCISLINTLTGMAVDLRTRRPVIANVTGGLSGPAVKPVALRMVYEVAQKVHVPVIGMGGITTAEDALEFMMCGASAVMVGTATLMNVYACRNIAQGMEAYVRKNGIDDINSFVGTLQV